MIDNSIESISVFMIKKDVADFPQYSLPEGFSFDFYKDGDEADWARLECELGQFTSEERGINCFKNEFLINQRLDPKSHVLFIKNEQGEIVASGALWDGDFLGERLMRIHWIAVSDKCRGKGIAKALISRLMELNLELKSDKPVYLWTGTRYYPAVAIYLKFGFEFYEGDIDPQGLISGVDFTKKNQRGIKITKEKIGERAAK